MFNTIIGLIADNLILMMTIGFGAAIVLRILLFYAVKRQAWFVEEFEKRVYQGLSSFNTTEDGHSFFGLLKQILQRTYHEIFDLRAKFARRKHDKIMGVGDRAFLVQEGCARFIMDFLRQARYLKKDNSQSPKFDDLSKTIIANNPVFGRLFAILPVGLTNNVLNMLPSIFIICGIFGTFLGIMHALPSLGSMDIANAEASKAVMDAFLAKIAFAMNTSIVGILLSVLMSILNTMMSPENIYFNIVNKFTSAIELIWNKCDHNEMSSEDIRFIDARDTIDIDSDHALKLDGKVNWESLVLADRRGKDGQVA